MGANNFLSDTYKYKLRKRVNLGYGRCFNSQAPPLNPPLLTTEIHNSILHYTLEALRKSEQTNIKQYRCGHFKYSTLLQNKLINYHVLVCI